MNWMVFIDACVCMNSQLVTKKLQVEIIYAKIIKNGVNDVNYKKDNLTMFVVCGLLVIDK